MATDRDDMARIIMLSCSTRMRPETALHYADNLIRAGYGKLPGPDPAAAFEEAALSFNTMAKEEGLDPEIATIVEGMLRHFGEAFSKRATIE